MLQAGLESYIAGMSTSMAHANFASKVSVAVLDKLLESDQMAGQRMIEDLASMPAPAAHEIGGLLNVTA